MSESIRNILGPRIRYYRKKLNITQEQLSARLNIRGIDIDRTIISQIETQKREIYDYEIYAIAKVLQIDFNEFFKDISLK